MAAAVIAVAALADACERRASTPPSAPPPGAGTDANANAIAEPRTLLALPVSAYHATIAADDDDTAYLLTPTAAYRLESGGAAPQAAPAATTGARKTVLFWGRQQFLPESNDYLTESVKMAAAKGGFDVKVELFSNDEHPQKEVVAMESKLATEVEAWALMGMNVFLGLRFGVWGKESPAEVTHIANHLLQSGLRP